MGGASRRTSSDRWREDVVAKTTKFKYVGLIIQSKGEIDKDVTHRVQDG